MRNQLMTWGIYKKGIKVNFDPKYHIGPMNGDFDFEGDPAGPHKKPQKEETVKVEHEEIKIEPQEMKIHGSGESITAENVSDMFENSNKNGKKKKQWRKGSNYYRNVVHY